MDFKKKRNYYLTLGVVPLTMIVNKSQKACCFPANEQNKQHYELISISDSKLRKRNRWRQIKKSNSYTRLEYILLSSETAISICTAPYFSALGYTHI